MIQAFPTQRRKILLIISAVVLLVYSWPFEAYAESITTVLHCDSLIDTFNFNSSMLRTTSVIVQNDRIKELVPGTELRPGRPPSNSRNKPACQD